MKPIIISISQFLAACFSSYKKGCKFQCPIFVLVNLTLVCVLILLNSSIFAQGSKSSLRKDYTILVNGNPIFLNGIYYNGELFTPEQRKSDLDLFASVGMNMIEASQVSIWPNNESFFDDAAKRGIYVTCEVMFDSTGTALDYITRNKNKSAVIGWNSADDSHRQFTIDQMRARNLKIKSLDPDRLSYQTVYKPTITIPYLPLTDMVWAYTYPVRSGKSGDNFINVQNLMDSLTMVYSTCYVGIPQAYNWATHSSGKPTNRFPDAKEYRNFVYQYIVYGIKGNVPYSFTDAGRLPDVAPDLWKSIKTCVKELNSLSPILIDGIFTRVYTGDKYLQIAQWEFQNQIYIVVVNISNTDTKKVSIYIPGNYTENFKALFPGQPKGCTLNKKQIKGTIGPMDVQVYRIGGTH